MRRLFIIIIFAIFFLNPNTSAQETNDTKHVYRNLKFYSCLNLVDLNGSAQVAEYEYLHNSVTLDGEARFIYLPHRMHLDLSIKNEKDHYLDLSYAYKDIILFRGRNNSMYHNLENIRLLDLDPLTPSPGINILDAGDDYGVQNNIGNFLLRLKTPNFPFHLFVEGTLIRKDGKQQQRFISGSAYFNEIVRASRDRDIDWESEDITIGTNSHLGPVEIEFLHGEKRFYNKGDDALYDNYSSAGFGTLLRDAGIYPHNLVPDLKGSYNTLKIHTSYTGRIVASATFSNIERENLSSNTRADYLRGYAEVTWMPGEKLTLFLNYRYTDRDVDNPDTVTIHDLSNPSNTYVYDVRQSISSVSKRLSATARYRVFNGLTLKLGYSRDIIKREDVEEWIIPERTTEDNISVTADLRLKKNLRIKTEYIHTLTDNPPTNIEPDTSDEGRVSITWLPLKWLSTLFSYRIEDGDRNNLQFLDITADNRHIRRHRFHSSVTLMTLKDLSLTLSYFYLSDKINQDIEYHDAEGIPHIDSYVPYKDISHNYSADITYIPHEKIEMNIGFNHTRSEGRFYPDDINLTEPVSIASFSELKTEGTVYYIVGRYTLGKNFSSGFHYRYSRLDDILDNPHDDVEDGRAHILLLTLSKEW
jgi:hypothetical protein